MEASEIQMLINKAIEAKNFAYCPYSNFRVGCSLITSDNKVFTGKNIK